MADSPSPSPTPHGQSSPSEVSALDAAMGELNTDNSCPKQNRRTGVSTTLSYTANYHLSTSSAEYTSKFLSPQLIHAPHLCSPHYASQLTLMLALATCMSHSCVQTHSLRPSYITCMLCTTGQETNMKLSACIHDNTYTVTNQQAEPSVSHIEGHTPRIKAGVLHVEQLTCLACETLQQAVNRAL